VTLGDASALRAARRILLTVTLSRGHLGIYGLIVRNGERSSIALIVTYISESDFVLDNNTSIDS